MDKHDLIVLLFAGNVSVGNMTLFLPYVLEEIEQQPKRQYLLLHSLKEVSWQIMSSINYISLTISHFLLLQEGVGHTYQWFGWKHP